MVRYVVEEYDMGSPMCYCSGVFDTYKEAENTAYEIWFDYEDSGDIKGRMIKVGKITEDDLDYKDDWESYTDFRELLMIDENNHY